MTSFNGSAYIDGGSCELKCEESNMVMEGMVYMGAYSNACVCGYPRKSDAPTAGAAAGADGAVVGVAMQMRRIAAQNATANNSSSMGRP